MITIVPSVFTKVEYEADRIAALATEAMSLVPALPAPSAVEVRVDEDQATTRASVVSLDPLVVAVDSGAFENLKDPRRLGDLETTITFARLYLEVVDRRSERFGAPSLDEALPLTHRVAWDVHLYGRVARLGLRLHVPRFRYDFRNRHGFTDEADQAFDLLWSTDDLTFARIAELSDHAAAAPAV